ncbi:unnamed protein product [Caenorhabditis angaria]|uniref:Fibronectin type-III domain-containing protein n=1 Tax=Caenorhabditis angaria TaxID=860376 RepID=A0A9P1N432_9PELO|nr:unnamed protein product [Caenorhabditis angaria]
MSTAFFVLLANCQTNPKTKCSLECYAKCMQSGTPSASTCNCPASTTSSLEPCQKFADNLKSATISQTLPKTHTQYIDAHMIRVAIDPQASAFAYIFEFSTISSDQNQWTFAGAAEKPEATFSISDPCRDYQFRVIIVVRSSDPAHIFEIIRPQPITVQLPPFILTQEQIHLELPRLSNSSQEIKMLVKWSLPHGYTDSDIYGYESPALYPIQCATPEDELAQPKIEAHQNTGGRLALTLPLSILETRCRIWVEVKMLPRCVRLEPFNIQKNIEIDCTKSPDLEICNKDSNPICFDDGDVEISGEHGKVKITFDGPKNLPRPVYYHVRYGPAQIKGTAPFVSWQLAAKREVRVDGSLNSFSLDIPEDEDFGVQVCAIMSKKRKRPKFGVVKVMPFQCTSCKATQNSVRCGDCSAILGSPVLESDWRTKNPVSESSFASASAPEKTTIYRMETDLAVKPHAKSTGKNLEKISPIDLEKAQKIIATVPPTTTSTVPSTTVTQTTTTVPLSTVPSSTVPPTTSTTKKMLSKEVELLEKVILESIEVQYPNSTVPVAGNLTTVDDLDPIIEAKMEEMEQQLKETLSNLAANSTELRHHEKSKKCLLSDGIVCEFGCETRKRCVCPQLTHARLRNGICATRDAIMHTKCFPKREINATWDEETGNVMIHRHDILQNLKNSDLVDKLFVDFGSVEKSSNFSDFEFDNITRAKIVVQIQTLLNSAVFSKEPFIFHVNRTIEVGKTVYGMRICVFNSSQIKDPQNYNFEDISKFEDEKIDILQISISPINFSNSQKLYSTPTSDTYWSTVVTVAKIAILVILALAMFILVYLNCTRIKSLYERKRTHYFRPFYIDPSIHTPGYKRDPSRGYYDVRTSNLIM